MGQVKGNPTPSAENAAFEAKYPNTGRANRDLGQIIELAVEEAIVEVAPAVVKAPAVEKAPIVEKAPAVVSAPIVEETPTTEEASV
jgi:hypothetical protein